jgi:DNA polymerase-4
MRILGRAAGRYVHAAAHGRDRAPLRRRGPRRSVGAQHALGAGPHSPAALDDALKGLVDRVTRRLRTAGRAGRTITLRLRFGDFAARATRSRTLPAPTAATRDVLAAARELLAAAMPGIEARGITLIGIAVSNLVEDGGRAQLALAGGAAPEPGASVDAALDEVRRRFGSDAVTRAALLRRSRRLQTWLMPGDDAEGERR